MEDKARCDVGLYVGATRDNARGAAAIGADGVTADDILHYLPEAVRRDRAVPAGETLYPDVFIIV